MSSHVVSRYICLGDMDEPAAYVAVEEPLPSLQPLAVFSTLICHKCLDNQNPY